MKTFFLSLFLLVSFALQAQAYSATATNCTGHGCNDGIITLNANSPCGDYSFYITGPNGYVNYSTANVPNGNFDITALAPGSYTVDIASSCCLQYNSSGTFCINPYSQAQSFTVTITEPACDLSFNLISINPATQFNCYDGQITFSFSSTTCSPIVYTVHHNGTPLPGFTGIYTTSGVTRNCYGLTDGNFEIIADNGFCQTSYPFTLGGPQCNIDVTITGSTNTSGVNCTNGNFTFESGSSSSCINNGDHFVSIYRDGNLLSTYSYNFSYPQQASNLAAGYYMVVVSNTSCNDTAYVEIEDAECNVNIALDHVEQSGGALCNNGYVLFTGTTNTCSPSTYFATLYKDGQFYSAIVNTYYSYWYYWNYQYGFYSLPPGNYTLKLYDGECTDSTQFVINQQTCTTQITIDNFSPSISHPNCQDGNIQYTPSTTSTCADWYELKIYRDNQLYTYTYNYVSNGPQAFSSLPAGAYYLTIWDGYCLDTSNTITITSPACNLDVVVNTVNPPGGYNCNNGSITFTASSGGSCYDYYFANVYKNGSFYTNLGDYFYNGAYTLSSLGTGDYQLVFGSNLCSYTTPIITVSNPPCTLTSSVDVLNPASNLGCNDGSVFYTPSDNSACANSYSAHLYKNGVYTSYSNYNNYSDGQKSFTNLGAGIYYIIINGDYGCSYQTPDFIISEPACSIDVTINITDSLSEIGCPSGAFEFTPINNSGPCKPDYLFTILRNGSYWTAGGWNSFANGSVAYSGLDPADYQVIIDNGSCTDTSEIIHIIASSANAITINLDAVNQITGYACNNGNIQFSVTNNNPCATMYYPILADSATGNWLQTIWWHNFGSGQLSFNNLVPGTYYVWAQNEFGTWSQSAPIHITEPTKPAFVNYIDAVNQITGYACNNGSIYFTPVQYQDCTPDYIAYLIKDSSVLVQNLGWRSYSWGQTSFSNLSPGTYYMVVWNGHYDDTSATYTITEPARIISTPSIDAVSPSTGLTCNNGSVLFTPIQPANCMPDYYAYLVKDNTTAMNHLGWRSYSWGQTSFTNLAPGNYYIVVWNGHYDDTSANFTITEPTSCDMTTIIDNTSFNAVSGCNSGLIYYTISGSSCPSYYSVTLYKNNTTFTTANVYANNQSSFSNLSAGTYYIVATNGTCSDTSLPTIINQALYISASLSNPVCNTSSITFTVTPANPITTPTYRWKKNGVTMQTSSSTTYTPASFTNGDNITCQLVGAGCAVISSAYTIQTTSCAGNAIVNLKLFLQGYCTSVNGDQMPTLLNEGVGTSYTQCDTVLVELHEAISPYSTSYSIKGVLNIDGTLSITLPGTAIGQSYYLGIRHRNTIETWSANPVMFGAITSYDFTTSANQAYGENQYELQTGVYAMYSGDLNQDGFIDSFDFPPLDTDIFNGVAGTYVNTDINGDGFVDIFDFPVFDLNSTNGVSSVLP